MYEQAYRLSELNTIEALEKQVKCYLAAKNALSLCDPEFQWVLRPVSNGCCEIKIILPPQAGTNQVKMH